MIIEELEKLFEEHTMVSAGEDLVLFEDLMLYNERTGEEKQYNSFEEIIHDETLEITPYSEISGGRGQRSGRSSGSSERNGASVYTPLPTARFNNQGRFVTQERAVKQFYEAHGQSNKEYAMSIDKNGFVHSYTEGNRGSVVPIVRGGKDVTIIHNHPNGSHFSKADYRFFASNKNVNTLIATTPSGKSHYITKTKNFKHKEFTKTISRVSADTVSDLNKHGKKMDRWLKKNAAKYGFTYEFK